MKIDKDWALFYGIMIGDGCISKCKKCSFVVISCSLYDDKPFFEKVKLLDFPVGKKGQIKISSRFDRNLWKYIIAGLFSTDGSLVIKNNNNTIYPRIEIQSISFRLLEQTKNFLIDAGLKGNVYKIERKNYNTIYRLEFPGITNLLKFKSQIGFVNPKHIDKLSHYLKNRHLKWHEWSWK
ncbi:MAG: LAGLIDADG family homing endonuclease [Candidatus Aenigmarchaeota archaeon]|nr:LAGLIDADG family homing endonuclease [Candidatus Aenigmarchaeota archaeon]